MRKAFLPFAAVIALIFCFSSCKKESVGVGDVNGENYYPLEIGKYVVYEVDSLVYDDLLHATLPFQCQLRYDVADTFRDDSGNLAYVIKVRYRKTELDEYTGNNVIYASVHDNMMVVTQNNLKFIKLVFPVSEGKNWNGNSMIPIGDQGNEEYDNNKWNYTYAAFGQPFNTGLKVYQNTVTVNEIDDSLNNPDLDTTAFAYRNYSQEIYGDKVGLIYSERIYWTFQPKAPAGEGGGSGYRKGYSVIMRAIDHN